MSNGTGIRIDVFHHIDVGSGVVQLIMQRLDLLQETIMAALDDKVAEITALFDTLSTGINTEIQQLAAAIAAGTDPTAAINNLTALGTRMQAAIDALKADDPLPSPIP